LQNSSFFRAMGLSSLSAAPVQYFGEISIVPLLRKDPPQDLRLFRRGVAPTADNSYALFPHGMIFSSKDNQDAQVIFGTQILKWNAIEEQLRYSNLKTRSGENQSSRRLRFLPLDLSTEGFVEHYYGATPSAWEDYATLLVSKKTVPTQEWAQVRESNPDIDECLRSFEMHAEQTGLLVFIQNELALAMVLPNHEDYQAVHPSILEDLCRGMFGFYGKFPTKIIAPTLPNDKQINDLETLRASVKRLKAQWSTSHSSFVGGALELPLNFSSTLTVGPFRYKRFGSQLLQTRENILGESIHRDSGRLEFLITYKLTRSETRRTYVVECFSRANWEPRAAAASMGISLEEFYDRMRHSGLAYLLEPRVLNEMRRLAKGGKKNKK
jgi:hypothetical protein